MCGSSKFVLIVENNGHICFGLFKFESILIYIVCYVFLLVHVYFVL